ncbi:hypothetical protein MS2017_1285 [Bathymodiolus thermophilus thioautotrophic gill symbiont]|uniref:UDP-glucose 4-epimerase n=1 Tax=Bathymodiolus thermophilus thioautotrophic gill symbiont TaxID=2360 RepID=A0A3G3IND9_9GAMM|nr:hypothetical protein MS2017_1285 [Bathymodiolus thermophilus thioautotrophic gill symbiont]
MMKNKTILVTGGAGYIGSHTCVELLEKGYRVIALDNYSNSSKAVIGKIKKITGKEIQVYEADVFKQIKGEVLTVNLGTGKSYSVLEIAKAFERTSGKKNQFCNCSKKSGRYCFMLHRCSKSLRQIRLGCTIKD